MDEADDNSIWYIDGVSVDDDNDSVGGLRADLEAKNHLPTSLAGWPALIKTQIEAHFRQDTDDGDCDFLFLIIVIIMII